jgi:hypothetical protein
MPGHKSHKNDFHKIYNAIQEKLKDNSLSIRELAEKHDCDRFALGCHYNKYIKGENKQFIKFVEGEANIVDEEEAPKEIVTVDDLRKACKPTKKIKHQQKGGKVVTDFNILDDLTDINELTKTYRV